MEDLVFEPLEMRRSTFDPTVAMTYPLAQSHDLVEDADRGAHLRVQHKYADKVGHYPAGFAISNVLDMANWMTIQPPLVNQVHLLGRRSCVRLWP
jgi:hypothetical protein